MSIRNIAFEFRADRVGDKSPKEIGTYIAGMGGSEDHRRATAALVVAIRDYDDEEERDLVAAFESTLEVYLSH